MLVYLWISKCVQNLNVNINRLVGLSGNIIVNLLIGYSMPSAEANESLAVRTNESRQKTDKNKLFFS
jgi:hypothetical protein